ncbi:sensor histidine kinase [Mastigocladopsis repens]|uniref:sensor histidine kinase n=1 Tax=Mastigocladopsis repens TaxID=221287 RepID=UPI0002DB29C9|nr:HAMP domain-containing sensor histidine kinase [Mastigocladopsis repens]
MFMFASSEFVALCREQLALLAQGLEASLSVVYLTQELIEASTNEAKFIPVLVYPETAVEQQGANALVLSISIPISSSNWDLPSSTSATLERTQHSRHGDVLELKDNRSNRRLLKAAEEFPAPSQEPVTGDAAPPDSTEESLLRGDQIVLPLVHEDVMMGLLVTVKEDRAWNEQERSEIERIAQTLSLACVLDQRRAWLHQQLQQQQILQEKQQDLLDNLLHQLRNPLTALRTFGKLLLKRLRPGDANREVAASIVRESDRLKELLQHFDEVIDLTAEDLGPVALPQKEVLVEANVQKDPKAPLLLPGTGDKEVNCSVLSILEPLLVSARAIAQERNLQLISEIPPNLPLVRTNPKALQEVLSNIIDNALKYTPTGGKILIQTGQEKPLFQGIVISDTGPGIPPQDLEHLGERHYRGVQAQTEIPGTGLGLSIAKQLIEQMQGEIQVFSPALTSLITSPDAPGTTFIIWLPVVSG